MNVQRVPFNAALHHSLLINNKSSLHRFRLFQFVPSTLFGQLFESLHTLKCAIRVCLHGILYVTRSSHYRHRHISDL